MELQGRRALVTGGAVRIGRAIVEALAGEGVDVAIHYRNAAREADALCEAIEARGGRAVTVHGSLSSEAACLGLIEEASKAIGPLDLLVNNASTFEQHRLGEVTESRLLGAYWSNLFAPVLLTRFFAAQTREGQIVNLLDRRVAGLDPSCIPYHLAKKGLAEFTRLAALELAPGIRVNGIAPGAVLSPPGESEDYLEKHAAPVPLQRRCTPGDIAEAVLALLRQDALTGQIIYVDGGQHLTGRYADG